MTLPALTDLQTALLNLARADAGVTALLGNRLYETPPSSPDFPFSSVDWGRFTDVPGECLDAQQVELQFTFWSREAGAQQAAAMAEAFRRALRVEEEAVAMTNHTLRLLRIGSAQVLRDDDGQGWHAVVEVSAIVDPN